MEKKSKFVFKRKRKACKRNDSHFFFKFLTFLVLWYRQHRETESCILLLKGSSARGLLAKIKNVQAIRNQLFAVRLAPGQDLSTFYFTSRMVLCANIVKFVKFEFYIFQSTAC